MSWDARPAWLFRSKFRAKTGSGIRAPGRAGRVPDSKGNQLAGRAIACQLADLLFRVIFPRTRDYWFRDFGAESCGGGFQYLGNALFDVPAGHSLDGSGRE